MLEETAKMKSLLILLLSLNTWGGDLKPPFLMPTAKVLPEGVRNLSYNGINSGASTKYSDVGTNVSVAEPLFKDLSFDNFLSGSVDAKDKATIQNIMNRTGLNGTDSFGTSTGDIDVDAIAHVPVFAMGVTKKLTMAVAIPIVKYSYSVSYGVNQANIRNYEAVEAAILETGKYGGVEEFYEKLGTPIQTKLEDYNYSQPQNEQGTKLGDIKLISRYQILNNKINRFAVLGELTLPTGKDQDINKVVDVPSGDDQWDVGAGFAYDYLLSRTLTLATQTTYTMQVADTNAERIPYQFDSKASPDVDFDTERDLGDIWASQVAVVFSDNGFNFGLGYGYQLKGSDRYTGSKYSSERYTWLEDETGQEMHSAQAMVGFDTISLYRKKKFFMPLRISVNHTRVLAGRNVVNDPLTSMDLSIFF